VVVVVLAGEAGWVDWIDGFFKVGWRCLLYVGWPCDLLSHKSLLLLCLSLVTQVPAGLGFCGLFWWTCLTSSIEFLTRDRASHVRSSSG
jgi:hypothetical protein